MLLNNAQSATGTRDDLTRVSSAVVSTIPQPDNHEAFNPDSCGKSRLSNIPVCSVTEDRPTESDDDPIRDDSGSST